jgi:hypothetical protein
MSITISATATGSTTLQQPEGDDKTQNIINGDFLITPNCYIEAILNILFSNVGGRILMRYNDDAIISYAQLDLTQDEL